MGEPARATGPGARARAGVVAWAVVAWAVAGCSVLYDFDPSALPHGAGEAGAADAPAADVLAAPEAGPPDAAGCPGADLARDANNCGACGVRCGAAQMCRDGACACGGGHGGPTACGLECVNVMNSPAHCGACGVACTTAAPECCSGVCRARCGQ